MGEMFVIAEIVRLVGVMEVRRAAPHFVGQVQEVEVNGMVPVVLLASSRAYSLVEVLNRGKDWVDHCMDCNLARFYMIVASEVRKSPQPVDCNEGGLNFY